MTDCQQCRHFHSRLFASLSSVFSPRFSVVNNELPTASINRLGRGIGQFLASPWALVLAVLLAFFLNSQSLPLTDVDEGAFSEATREMLDSGNLISPTLNGRPRHDKPILIYWAQAASVTLLGEREFAFRLPSLIAAVLWLLALYRFCRRQTDQATAQVACLVMALSLQVGIIAKAAIADALLNLFICLALFLVYEYLKACRAAVDATKTGKILMLMYGAVGLGFLTKGPVAVFFPLLIGGLFALTTGALRPFLRGLFHFPGWLLFLAIVVPWHVLVYLDQGDAFFRGFYLKHNVDRYASTFEGHGGRLWYYAVILPVVLMPFTGWLLALGQRLLYLLKNLLQQEASEDDLLDRFLLLWFAVVFVFFSFSGTQLPHYLLYGCTPLFIFLARHRVDRDKRLLLFLPALLFALLLALLPWVLELAIGQTRRPYDLLMLSGLRDQFAVSAWWLVGSFPLLLAGLYAWRQLPAWQGLVLAGLLQAIVMQGFLMPKILAVSQQPIQNLAHAAQKIEGSIVSYRVYLPSFSVYRQASTPVRLPLEGEYVFTRTDRLQDLNKEIAPLEAVEIQRDRFVLLARVVGPAKE
jgi:4-amino-4-deoxy-L-arabinose transferase-like glycosyltransferase